MEEYFHQYQSDVQDPLWFFLFKKKVYILNYFIFPSTKKRKKKLIKITFSSERSQIEIWSSAPETARTLSSSGCHWTDVILCVCHLKWPAGTPLLHVTWNVKWWIKIKEKKKNYDLKFLRSQMLKLPSSEPDNIKCGAALRKNCKLTKQKEMKWKTKKKIIIPWNYIYITFMSF